MQTITVQPPEYVAMIELALLAQRQDVMTRFLDSAVARATATRESRHKAWLVDRIAEAFPGGDGSLNEPLQDPEALVRLLPLVPCEDPALCYERRNLLGWLRRDARARGNFVMATTYADSLIATQRQRHRFLETERDGAGRLGVYPRTDFFHSFAYWYDDTTFVTGPVSGSTGAPHAWERVRKGVVEVGDNPDNPFVEYAEGNRHYLFMDSLFRLNRPVKFPALTPKAWIGSTGTASAPTPGRVLLIIDRAQMYGFRNLWVKYRFPAVTAALRRLHSKYAALGFDIVWVVESQGHFQGSSVLSFDEEQKALAAYWFGYHKVPGVIALDQTSFAKRPDNRLIPRTASVGVTMALARLNARAGNMIGLMYLMDRNGNLLTPAIRMDGARESEIALERLIERALAANAIAK